NVFVDNKMIEEKLDDKSMCETPDIVNEFAFYEERCYDLIKNANKSIQLRYKGKSNKIHKSGQYSNRSQ
ncbi:MAG: hypothetical protein R3321_13040, partial [Nitrososphaeraceae archaeon]|nr:hypothetical protein [Nitrososphaeraceae archaeon]